LNGLMMASIFFMMLINDSPWMAARHRAVLIIP
jgi:hypothetical protein